jgi:hypothetical protein
MGKAGGKAAHKEKTDLPDGRVVSAHAHTMGKASGERRRRQRQNEVRKSLRISFTGRLIANGTTIKKNPSSYCGELSKAMGWNDLTYRGQHYHYTNFCQDVCTVFDPEFEREGRTGTELLDAFLEHYREKCVSYSKELREYIEDRSNRGKKTSAKMIDQYLKRIPEHDTDAFKLALNKIALCKNGEWSLKA